jgi:HAD superfamily hydrolase (TIGR01490 family)
VIKLVNKHVKRFVFFDLDHTLLPIDSDYSWGVFTTTIGWVDPAEFGQQNEKFYAHYQAGTLDIHDYVRFATAAIKRQGEEKFIAAHQQFMYDVVRPAITEPALALIQQHSQAGDTAVIVTATNELITRPIAEALGVPELIAVELARDAAPGGWITGEIKGVPSMREGKVTRVAAWLAARGLGWADINSTFYSDSINDLPLLEQVNHPVATNPDDRLRAIAQARGWRILDLFQKI